MFNVPARCREELAKRVEGLEMGGLRVEGVDMEGLRVDQVEVNKKEKNGREEQAVGERKDEV